MEAGKLAQQIDREFPSYRRSSPDSTIIFRLFIETFCQKSPVFLKELIEDVEKSMIITVLSRVHGNQKKAAEMLCLKYTTLNEKVKKYGIRFKMTPVQQ